MTGPAPHHVPHAPLGVIEGFFGTPWGWRARAAAADFLGGLGYDFYIYAPKADRHLGPGWRERRPAAATARLAALAGRCRDNGLDFGVGLRPVGLLRDFDAPARADLRRAVRRINDVGPDMLCLLLDDMPGEASLAARVQADAMAEVAAAGTARRFVFCPTRYSFDPRLEATFGAAPERYLSEIGARMDAQVAIFWTGPAVRSSAYPADHLRKVAGLLGRKPFLWDNHLANDGAATSDFLFLETARRRPDLAGGLTAGCAVNPMNQPHLSRLPLRTIATGEPFADACAALCGDALGREIANDRRLFQERGRAAMTEGARAALAAKYAAFADSACAREVAAWLAGAYPFDPACTTG